MISKKENRGLGIEPHDNDVLCWSSGKPTAHPGNAMFYEKVQSHKHGYSNARFNRERRVIVESIVDDFKKLDPPGRFLSRDGQNGPWYEIEEEKALEKVSHALRLNAMAKANWQSRNEEKGGDYSFDFDFDISLYQDILSGVMDKFMCPASLEDIGDEIPLTSSGKGSDKPKTGRDDKQRGHNNSSLPTSIDESTPELEFTFSYKPNEYGLPEGRDDPDLRLQKTFSYKPNKYGLAPGQEDPDLQLLKSFSYKPNQYGLPAGREEPDDLKSLPSISRDEPDLKLMKTFSYKPNMYGLRDPNEPEKSKLSESEYTDDYF